jgi:hypothetical protein
MQRYEFEDRERRLFVHLTVGARSLTTTEGEIGTEGRSTTQTFPGTVQTKKAFEEVYDAHSRDPRFQLVACGAVGPFEEAGKDERSPAEDKRSRVSDALLDRLPRAQVEAHGGATPTVQGALVWAITALEGEALKNGNSNFDVDPGFYKGLADVLRKHLVDREVFDARTIARMKKDLAEIRRGDYPGGITYERVGAWVIDWCEAHPDPINLKKKRRAPPRRRGKKR